MRELPIMIVSYLDQELAELNDLLKMTALFLGEIVFSSKVFS